MESKTELQRSQDLCHRRMLTISGMERELAEVYDRANNLRLAYDAQTRKLAEAQEAKGHFYDKMCDREDELAALRTAAARVVSKLESMKEFGDEPDEDDLQEWHEALAAAREEAERKVDILRTKLHAAEMYSTTQWVLDAQAERDQLQQRLDAVRDEIKGHVVYQGYEVLKILAGTEGGKDDA